MEELIETRDPRGAEVLITTMCEGYMSGSRMTDALIEIGPPAVPYILPYLEKGMKQGGTMASGLFRSLSSIAVEHRAALGGIVEHILIPKFAEIAGDETFERYDPGTVIDARAALALLGR